MINKSGKGFDPQCSVCKTTFDTYTKFGPRLQASSTCPICEVSTKAELKPFVKKDERIFEERYYR